MLKMDEKTDAKINFISIELCDIDFQMTFINLLETIHRGFSNDYCLSEPLTKKVITEAIFSGIEFHYLLFQLRENLNQKGYGDLEETIRYLHKNIKIFFNEEALKNFMKTDGMEGCWILNTQTGEIASY
jgi:hypothetical protein